MGNAPSLAFENVIIFIRDFQMATS